MKRTVRRIQSPNAMNKHGGGRGLRKTMRRVLMSSVTLGYDTHANGQVQLTQIVRFVERQNAASFSIETHRRQIAHLT